MFNTIKLTGANNYLSKPNHLTKIIVVIITFSKSMLWIVYLSSIVSLLFVNVYFNGYTKPFVNTNLVNSQYNQLLEDLDKIDHANLKISSFTNLFNKDELYTHIKEFSEIVHSIDQLEESFMDDVFSDLSKERQSKIEDLYSKKFGQSLDDEYLGVFSILSEDEYYKDVFNIPTGFVSKIPLISNIVYKNDLHLTYYTFIEENQDLIEYINDERTLFTDIDLNFQEIIVSLSDYEDELIKIKDKKNLVIIDDVFTSIDKYYTISNWIIDVIEETDDTYFIGEIEPYQIIDQEVNDFLSDREHLDQVIKHFNQDYKKNKFNNKKLLADAYEFTNIYLNEYQEMSLKIEQNIDPKFRLGAAYFVNEIEVDEFTLNGETLQILLSYLNQGCDDTCNYEQTYQYLDIFIYGYLYDFEYKELSDAKLDAILKSIDDFGNKGAIISELKEFNDQLIVENDEPSYIEYNYHNGNISYQILKLLYIYEEYTTEDFHTEIKALLK
jgi:hypothetical protein